MFQYTEPTRAFEGNEELKIQTLEMVKEKIHFNSFVRGSIPPETDSTAWFSGTLNESGYKKSMIGLGFPELLMYLEVSIFRGLPQKQGDDFSLSFIEKTPVGADLSQIVDKFCYWMLTSEDAGMINHLEDETAMYVKAVAEYYKMKIKGGIFLEPEINEFRPLSEEDWMNLCDAILDAKRAFEPVTDLTPNAHGIITLPLYDMEDSEYSHRYDVLTVALTHCFAHMSQLCFNTAAVASNSFMHADKYCSFPIQAQKLLDLLSDTSL